MSLALAELDPYTDDPEWLGDEDWYEDAIDVLTEYLSTVGKKEFTTHDFRLWASYYRPELVDPHRKGIWGAVFRRARYRGMIKAVARPIHQKGYALPMRWRAL